MILDRYCRLICRYFPDPVLYRERDRDAPTPQLFLNHLLRSSYSLNAYCSHSLQWTSPLCPPDKFNTSTVFILSIFSDLTEFLVFPSEPLRHDMEVLRRERSKREKAEARKPLFLFHFIEIPHVSLVTI